MSSLKMQVIWSLVPATYFIVYNFLLMSMDIVTVLASGKNTQNYLLRSIKLVEKGAYNQLRSCPDGQFVVGIRKRVLKEDGAIREIVTGLEATCSDRITTGNRKFSLVFGKGGTWGEYLGCPIGFGVGLTVKIVYSRPELMDRKVGNITLHCATVSNSDLMNSLFSTIQYNQNSGFSYDFAQFCVNGEGITQISVRANSEILYYEGEKIKIKTVDIDCRRMRDNSVNFCKLDIKWDTIPVKNCSTPYLNKGNSDYRVNCSFDAVIGVEYNRKIQNLPKILKSYNLMDGNISPHLRNLLMYNLMDVNHLNKLSPDVAASIYAFVDANWSTDQLLKVNIIQPLHRGRFVKTFLQKSTIRINETLFDLKSEEIAEQLIGICGIYMFRFNKFKTRPSAYFNTVINDFQTKVVFSK